MNTHFPQLTCSWCNILQWMHDLPVQTTTTANTVQTAASCLFQGVRTASCLFQGVHTASCLFQGVQRICHTSLAVGATLFSGCTLYPYKPQQQFTCCRCNVLWWMHDLPLQMTATAKICQLQQVVFFKEYSIFSTLHLLLMQPVVRRISLFHPHKQQKSQCCDCNQWPL